MMMDIDEVMRRQQLVESIKYGLIIVSSIPIFLMYPVVRRFVMIKCKSFNVYIFVN